MRLGNKDLNVNFILLMLGRMVSDTGTSIQAVIMPLYIIDARGSAATVGLFSFLSLFPAILIYPIAGVLADRLDRKVVTIVTDLASAVVITGLAFAAYTGRMSLNLLLGVQIIVSLLYGLFDPATKGMLPQLVTQDKLTQANASLATLRILGGLLGPVIGTALYASLGITTVFLINGISFLLSAGSSTLIRYQYVKRASAVGLTGFAADLSQGAKFISVNKAIRKMCIFLMVVASFIQPVFAVVLPLFFRTQLNYSDRQYGYLQMIIILGALIGSILVAVLFGKREDLSKPLLVGCSMLIVTILSFSILLFPKSLAALGNGTALYLALLSGILCLLSTAAMLINVPIQTFIQRATPDEFMSRVFSIVGMITKGGMPLGAFVYGIALTKAPVHWTVFAAALLTTLISTLFLSQLSGAREHSQKYLEH